ncbi:MAG TPA: hypothetical protein VLB44_05030 [Kofleriaceae bacterium]|nr:hypothetical protein [Kofleriaceae bacterium]
MWRAAALLVLLGCGDAQHAPDAPVDDAVCKANLETALDRSCNVPSDCVLVESADCCGPIMLGIHAGTESAFPSLEQTFETCLACPPLGCAHQILAENGTAPQSGQMIVADCVASRCVSVVR